MAIFDTIAKWFVKYAWPQIQKLLIAFIKELVEKIFKKILELIFGSTKTEFANARNKAKEASERARTSASASEAEKYMAVAEAWMEVADNYKKQAEELMEKINKLQVNVTKQSLEKVTKLDAKEVFEVNDDTVKLSKPIALLPEEF